MKQNTLIQLFNQQVLNKYHLYNSLFLKLPYEKIKNIGILLPILSSYGREKLEEGMSPTEIISTFFDRFTNIKSENDRIDFMLKVIQYVERQIVLFDSVEDAALPVIQPASEPFELKDIILQAQFQQKEEELLEFLSSFSVRLVFTAHPTQFYPPSVQYILHDLKEAIQIDDTEKIDLLLQQLGQTPFYNKERPSPVDEANSIVYYLRNVYYESIGDLYVKLSKQLPSLDNPNLFQLGFWPGGDRDGNPFVTHEVTAEVARLLKNTLMKCYYNDLKKLRRKVTFHEVSEILKKLSNKLYSSIFDVNVITDYREIKDVLEQVYKIIEENNHGLFNDEVRNLLYKVNCFKLHFASLDIRQDSSIHRLVINKIREKYGNEVKPIDILNFEEDIIKDTLLNIRQIKNIQQNNGEQGCNRYIISNSEYDTDVLAVLHMFKYCGYNDNEINVDIIPLFETIHGLNACIEIMTKLFNNDEYKSHLRHRGNRQTIMLGFSDGTKDGGYLKANWEIYKAKMQLTKLCNSFDVEVVFFDGRGGPPARGGGKTQRFYASQGQNIAYNEIQLTIQGQTITSMYGNSLQFMHNIEQLMIAGINNALYQKADTIWTQDKLDLMEELANLAYEKYEALKNHHQFIPYLEKRSTLRFYTKTNIGSRPGKRGSDANLKFSDLRAIPFVGSWSQMKQNVPGHFGIGTAIKKLKDANRIEEVKTLYNKNAFFKALILNSMMALKKSFYKLTNYLHKNEEFKDFYKILTDEYYLSKEMVLEISGQSSIMEEEALSKASIDMREDIVIPLLIIQQYALEKINEEENIEIYEKLVIRSMFGNINASRNSA